MSATPRSSLHPWDLHQRQWGTSDGSRPEPGCCRCCTAALRARRCSWQSRCQKCQLRRQSPPGFQELRHTQCTHHRLNKEIKVKDRHHYFWERWKHVSSGHALYLSSDAICLVLTYAITCMHEMEERGNTYRRRQLWGEMSREVCQAFGSSLPQSRLPTLCCHRQSAIPVQNPQILGHLLDTVL